MIEDDKARLNQEWSELLGEIRVLLPGTEVLFAFLLTIPFSDRFASVPPNEKTLYFVALLASAAGTLLLMSPGVQHRLLWRRGQKDEELRVATRLVLLGSLAIALAVSTVVYLITNLLYAHTVAAITTGMVIGLLLVCWLALPLYLRARRSDVLAAHDAAHGESHATPVRR